MKTHLRFVKKLSLNLFDAADFSGSYINIWIPKKLRDQLKGIDKTRLWCAVVLAIESPKYSEKFPLLDIILLNSMEKYRQSQYQTLLYGRPTSNLAVAYVTNDELIKGMNIVCLDMAFCREFSPSNRVNWGKVTFFLVHELTHLWHLRQSNVLSTRERYLVMFQKAAKLTAEEIDKLRRSLDLIYRSKYGNLDENQIRQKMLEAYIFLRQILVLFKSMVIFEGIATFSQFYSRDSYRYDTCYQIALTKAQELQRRGQVYLEEISNMFKWATQKIKLEEKRKMKGRDSVMNHINFQMGIAEKQIDQMGDVMIGGAPKISTIIKDILANSYNLGIIIPARLIKAGMTLDEIGRLSQQECFRRYEEVSVKNGEMPVISVFPQSNAVFNLGKLEVELNTLRKSYGIRA